MIKRTLILTLAATMWLPILAFADGNESQEALEDCRKEATMKKIPDNEKEHYIGECMRAHIIEERTKVESEKEKMREKMEAQKEK